MNLVINSKDISREKVEKLFKINNFEFNEPNNIVNIYNALTNCTLVISIWNNSELYGYCSVLSDTVYFGRIQEFILHPEIKKDNEYLNIIVKSVFEQLPLINTFHLNPNVFEKKLIYTNRHGNKCPSLKKIYWSIHEDEY